MQDEPLNQHWQRAAVIELNSLLTELCQDRFSSVDDFCIQMSIAAQLLRALHDQSEIARIEEWRRRLNDLAADFPAPEGE